MVNVWALWPLPILPFVLNAHCCISNIDYRILLFYYEQLCRFETTHHLRTVFLWFDVGSHSLCAFVVKAEWRVVAKVFKDSPFSSGNAWYHHIVLWFIDVCRARRECKSSCGIECCVLEPRFYRWNHFHKYRDIGTLHDFPLKIEIIFFSSTEQPYFICSIFLFSSSSQ